MPQNLFFFSKYFYYFFYKVKIYTLHLIFATSCFTYSILLFLTCTYIIPSILLVLFSNFSIHEYPLLPFHNDIGSLMATVSISRLFIILMYMRPRSWGKGEDSRETIGCCVWSTIYIDDERERERKGGKTVRLTPFYILLSFYISLFLRILQFCLFWSICRIIEITWHEVTAIYLRKKNEIFSFIWLNLLLSYI